MTGYWCFVSFFQFEEMESLGYRCVALGFFEEDVQAASTTDCACCVTPATVQYIRALTIAGSPVLPTIVMVTAVFR